MEINTVEQIVRQRIGTLDYIKKTASGRVHWMNVMKITPSDIRGTFDAKHIQKRLDVWFPLGNSLAPLLEQQDCYKFITALSQLMEEIEYYFGNAVEKQMKYLRARTVLDGPTAEEISSTAAGIIVRPALCKAGRTVLYHYLNLQIAAPFTLDFCEVLLSLCDMLQMTYTKFLQGGQDDVVWDETVLKLDASLSDLVIKAVSRDLTTIVLSNLKSDLGTPADVQEMWRSATATATPPPARRASLHGGVS